MNTDELRDWSESNHVARLKIAANARTAYLFVRGSKGAVSCCLLYDKGRVVECTEPAFHSLSPIGAMYGLHSEKCFLLDDRPCWFDVREDSQELYHAYKAEGEVGVWDLLTEIYKAWY